MNFDAYVRESFDSISPMERVVPAHEHIVTETRYGANLAANEIFRVMAEGTASHIVLIDAELYRIDWLRDLITEIASLGHDAFFTLNCPGLAEVYAINARSEESGYWPSWLLVIPRSFFQTWTLDGLTYKTLEFALLDCARETGRNVKIFGDSVPLFDATTWAGELVLYHADRLATDYEHLRQNEPKEVVDATPYQLRVTTHYQPIRFDSIDKILPQDGPLFTIICPVFKSRFIGPLVESICKQSFDSWELRLGVDGPAKEEITSILQILETFEDPRIHVFVQENRGTGPTRQRLAEESQGTYILSVDDDDLLLPQALEVFATALAGTPEAEVIRGGAQLTGLSDMPLLQRKRYLVNGIANDIFEVTQPYVIKRSLLKEIGGYQWDESLRNAGEDTFLFHRLDIRGVNVYLLTEVLYLRRLSTSNLSLHFRPEEAMAHTRNLDTLFTPDGWKMNGRKITLDSDPKNFVRGSDLAGNYVRAIAQFTQEGKAGDVVTGTRFFHYQTLGDLDDVTIDLEVTSSGPPSYVEMAPGRAKQRGFHMKLPLFKNQHIALQTVNRLANDLRGGRKKVIVLCGVRKKAMHPHLTGIVRVLIEAGMEVQLAAGSDVDEGQRALLENSGSPVLTEERDRFKKWIDSSGESNLCMITKTRVFISTNGEMRLCGMDGKHATKYGNVNDRSIKQMHHEKLLDYVRGKHQAFCHGCNFCPGKQ